MLLIATICALLLERLLGQIDWWGRPLLLQTTVRGARGLLRWPELWTSPAIVPLLLLPPLGLTALIEQQIENPFVSLGFSALVLLLCLGPRDLADDLHEMLRAHAAGDVETTRRLARALQRGPRPDASHRSLVGAMFIQSHERLFGILLWFFVLGPIGAVAYRVASRLPRVLHADGNTLAADFADALHGLMAWIPARITALLFGMAGSLDDALRAWSQLRFDPVSGDVAGWSRKTWAVLAETATGGLETDGEDGGGPTLPPNFEATLHEVMSLQNRALLILLAFFAFFATGAWVSGF
ncbi:regulatory signaling modulator protein AmpE [Hydrocarboniphaga sp.]|uniref:regulatory signaling modulator protein AmpE n=1 Tax=Hydrocarboniphaga sp. TaxID=2033016 RepID=UPI003D116487